MSNELLVQATIRHLLRAEQERLYPHGAKAMPEIKTLAEKAQRVFGHEKGHTSLQKLEGLALRTDLVTDILDFVKRQTGKKGSAERWQTERFGFELVALIEGPLQRRAEELAKSPALTQLPNQPYRPDELRLLVWLELTRTAISHLVAHARFAAAGQNGGR
ncbi:MAG: hypothetical protein OZSIB_1616 [Candidatus Ozemobacter sibiricus]|jgi:hypothetical protein|uniref:CRISPR type III-B/RAMP module-associated protein Cmr5 n=1 Tax=Candidatus Ozemobacter sibiricus TaxID=2268124 RepID=A0A367ZKG1_9BACT|nr:MAG: hypothetical protein OZSIB_1616 [Candidatus Ozemobacter sibiricus]